MEQKDFDELMESLEDAAAFARGDTSRCRVVEVEVPNPSPAYRGADVERTRKALNLTQSALAHAIGVSPKLVEAWEAGKHNPSGAACRLLYLLDGDHSLLERLNAI